MSTLENLGNAYGESGQIVNKRDLLERALAIATKEYGPDASEVGHILTNLGTAYGSLGDVCKKAETLERALNIQKSVHGPDHHLPS